MKLTGGILGWGGERLGGVHGSLVGYVTPDALTYSMLISKQVNRQVLVTNPSTRLVIYNTCRVFMGIVHPQAS